MKKIAIIPARGGSKRLPGKNIREFSGKPVIAYSIEAALQSELFDEVMVSTDNREIADISKRFGAKVPFMRSTENSGDHATIHEVISEVLEHYKAIGFEFELCCCILPTAPLIQQKHLKKGLTLLLDSSFDSVRPLVRFPYPIQRAWFMLDNGSIAFSNMKFAKTRSQDLEPAFHDAAQFYWFRTKGGMSYENCGGFVIGELETQDIDSEEDWQMLCLKYELLKDIKTGK